MIRLTHHRRALIGSIAAALAIAGSSSLSAQAAAAAQGDLADETTETQTPPAMTEGEQRLARLLKGRVPGEPTSCIRSLANQRMQTIDGTAYVYGAGDTIWVQRTRNPQAIDNNDALVTNRFSGTQLCRLDITTTIDRVNGFFTGVVLFEDFVPYTRVKPATDAEG